METMHISKWQEWGGRGDVCFQLRDRDQLESMKRSIGNYAAPQKGEDVKRPSWKCSECEAVHHYRPAKGCRNSSCKNHNSAEKTNFIAINDQARKEDEKNFFRSV